MVLAGIVLVAASELLIWVAACSSLQVAGMDLLAGFIGSGVGGAYIGWYLCNIVNKW